jgi:predicted XRE-type DNA-binding protein
VTVNLCGAQAGSGLRSACISEEVTRYTARTHRIGQAAVQGLGAHIVRQRIVESTGNVFADLGFSEDEAALHAKRAELIGCLRLELARKGWSAMQAALALGIDQSQASDLMRGRQENFSLDMLVALAAKITQRVA